MACSDCAAARVSKAHRLFDPRCLWCGARYARAVRTSPRLVLPAMVGGRECGRREWFDHVIATWALHGHDAVELRELAMAEAVPYEPVRGRADG